MTTTDRVIAVISAALLFAGLVIAAWLYRLSDVAQGDTQAFERQSRAILERCSEIPELEEFITHFEPEMALEFYHGDKTSEVSSVASVV